MYKIVGDDKKEYGPVTADQIREWITQGRANAHTMIQAEGQNEWRPLASLPEFYAALNPVSTGTTGALPPLALPPGPPRTNAMAVAGFVTGILSFLFGWFCCSVLIFTPVSVVFSCIGLGQISKRREAEKGRGFAIAGIILSVVAVIGDVLLYLFFMAAGASGGVLEEILNKR